jgi:hypothetical protein
MWDVIYDHWIYYCHAAWRAWQSLGPIGYVSVLTFVGVFGFLAMKGKKRH